MKTKPQYRQQPSPHSTTEENELLRMQIQAAAKDLAAEASESSQESGINLEVIAQRIREHHGLGIQLLQCAADFVPDDQTRAFAAMAATLCERVAERTLADGDPAFLGLREMIPDIDRMLVFTNLKGTLPPPRDFAGWAETLNLRGTSLKVSFVPAEEGARFDHTLLTRSQIEGLARLECNWAITQAGEYVAGTGARPIPLIVGPSGSGKTRLVEHFADSISVPVLKLSSGNWSPSGSRVTPCTHETIRDFVSPNARGIVFIDEVDKFTGEQDYYRSVQIEVFAILDGNLDGFAGWSEEERERFRRRFLIVGAGTWQDMFRANQRSVGFTSGPNASVDAVGDPIDLRNQTAIPEELLNRFNARLIHLLPPTAEDFRARFTEIHQALGIALPSPARMDKLVRRALESGKHNRAVEAYLNFLLEKKVLSSGAVGTMHRYEGSVAYP